MACIGNSHCIKANVNTKELATKIEKLVFPSPILLITAYSSFLLSSSLICCIPTNTRFISSLIFFY